MSRAQVSIENLATYSFAFLAVIIVISIGWYFGLFEAETYVAEKCSVGENLGCPSYTLVEDSATNTVYLDMDLTNYNDESIRVVAVKIKQKNTVNYCESYTIVAPDGSPADRTIGSFGGDEDLRFAIQDGQSGCDFVLSGLDNILGNKESFDVQLVYEKGESTLPFSSSGRIIARTVEETSGFSPPPPPANCVIVTPGSCSSECDGDGWSDDGGVTCYDSSSCTRECNPSSPPPPGGNCVEDAANCGPTVCSPDPGWSNDGGVTCYVKNDNNPCTTVCPPIDQCDPNGKCDTHYCGAQGEGWLKNGDCYSDAGCTIMCPKCEEAPLGNCRGRCGDRGYALDGVGCYTDATCRDECPQCIYEEDCCSGANGHSADGGVNCFTDPDCTSANRCETSCSEDDSCNSECSPLQGHSLNGVGCYNTPTCNLGSECTLTTCMINDSGDCSGRCIPIEGFSDSGVGCYNDDTCTKECPECELMLECCKGIGGWSIDGGINCFDADTECQSEPCDSACMEDVDGTYYMLGEGVGELGGNCYEDSLCSDPCDSETCYQDPICCGSTTYYSSLTRSCYTDSLCRVVQGSCPPPSCEASTCCGGGGYSMGGYGCYSDSACLNSCLCGGSCKQQDLSFNQQVNYFSIYVDPSPTNTMLAVVQPIIDEGKLVSVTDEDGNRVYYSGGWIDEIGTVDFLEGYIIRVTTSTSLSVSGDIRVNPTTKFFTDGYNLFGMPKLASPVDAKTMMNPMITQGCFVNMTNDDGDSLYYDGVWIKDWKNNIGDVVVDEGYIVYTNTSSCSLSMDPYI